MGGLLTLVPTIVMLALTTWTCGNQRQREGKNTMSHESFQEMTVCKGQTVTVNIWPNVSSVEDLIGYPPLDSRGRNLRGQCAYVFSGQDPRPFVIFTYSLSGLRFEIISPSAKFSDKFPWLLTFYNIDKLDSRYISCTVQNGSLKAWKTNFNFIVTDMKSPLLTSNRITVRTLPRNNVMTVECSLKTPVLSGYPPIHLALRGPYGELIESSKLPTLLSTLPDGYLAGTYSCVLEGQAMACISPRLVGSQLNASIHIESILPRPIIEHPPFLIGRDDAHVNCTVLLNQFAAADLGSGHPLTWDINGLPQRNLGSTRRWRLIPEGRVGVLQYVSELFLGTVGILHIEQNITCTVRVGLKTSASSWIVQVVFPPLPPTILGPDSVLIGDVTQFRCVTEGASLVAPTINWDDNSGRQLQDMTHSSYVTYQERSQWKASQYSSNRLRTPETLNNGRWLRLKRSALFWRSSVLTKSDFQRFGHSPRKLYDATPIIKRVRKRWKGRVSASVQVFSTNNNARNRRGSEHKIFFLPSRLQADVEPGTTIPPWKFVARNTLENSDFSVENTTPSVKRNGERTEGQETKTRKDRKTVSRARGAKRKEHKSTGKDTAFSTEQYSRAVKLDSVAQTDLFTRTDSPAGHRSKRANAEVKDAAGMPIESIKDGKRLEIASRVSQSKRYASSGSEDDDAWLFGGENFEDEENNRNKEPTQSKPVESANKEPSSVTSWKQGNDEKVKGSQHDLSRRNTMSPLSTENNISASNEGQKKGGYFGADHEMKKDGLENRLNPSSTQTQRHGNSDGRKSGLEDEGPDSSYLGKKHKATTMYRVVSVLDFLPLPEARETELKCILHHLTLAEKIIAIKKVYITDPPFEPVILGPNEIRQGENATWTCNSKGPSSSPPIIKWSDNQSRDLTPLSWTSSTTFLGEDGRLWHNVTSKLTYSPSWQERDIKLRCTATFSIITISVSGMINISVKDDSSSLSEKLGSADVTGSTHTQTETSSGENTSAPRLHPERSSGSDTKTLVNSVPNGEQEPKANMHASPEEQSLVYSMSKTRRYLLESTSNTGDNDMEASVNNSTRSTSNTDDNNNLVDKHSMQVSENNSATSASNTSDNGNLVDKQSMQVSGNDSVSSRSSQERNNLDYSSGRSDASVIPPTKADDLKSSRDNTSEKKILELSDLRVLLKTLHTRGKTLPTWKRHEFLSDNTTSVGNVTKKIEMDTDSNISSEAELRGSPKPFDDDKTTVNFNTSYNDTKVSSPAESEVSHSQEMMNSFRKEDKTLQTNGNESAEKKLYTAGNSTSSNINSSNTLSNEEQGSGRYHPGSADNSLNTSNPISYKVNFTKSNTEKDVYSDLGVESYVEGSKARSSRHPSTLNDKVNSSVATSSGKLNLTSQENTLSPKHTDLEVGVKTVHEKTKSKYPVVKNTRKQERNESDDSRSERLNLASWTKSPEVTEIGLQGIKNKTTIPLAERAKEHPRNLKTNSGIHTSVTVRRGAPNRTSWDNSSNTGNILDSQLGVKNDEEEKIRHPRFENTKQRPNNLQAEDGVISDVISRNDAQNLTSQPVTAGHNSSQPVTGHNRSQPVKTGGKDKELGSGLFDGKVSLVTPRLSTSEASFPPLNSMMPNTGEKDWKAHVDQPVPQLYDDYDRFENFEKPDKKNVEKEPARDLPADAGTDKMMFAAGFVSVFILLVLVALGLLWYKRLRRHPDPTDGY